MRFPISLACLGLMLSAALGVAAVSQTPNHQAQTDKSADSVVAYRGSGRLQW
jgi:hypothetical protein